MRTPPALPQPPIQRRRAAQAGTVLSAMLVPPLAGCAVQYLVDAPPDRQPFIDPPFLLLVLVVSGVLLGQQGLDLRRQRLDGEGCHSVEVKEAEQIRKSVYNILRQEQREQQPRRAQDMGR